MKKIFAVIPAAVVAFFCVPSVSAGGIDPDLVAVTSAGDVVPCMQMSGYFETFGIHPDNLYKKPLAEILSAGPYHDMVHCSLLELMTRNKTCAACCHFVHCAGGCRALGYLFSGSQFDYYAPDPFKCAFFQNGWYEKICRTLQPRTNLKPLKR